MLQWPVLGEVRLRCHVQVPPCSSSLGIACREPFNVLKSTDLALNGTWRSHALSRVLKVKRCCLQLPSQQRLKASRRSHAPRGAPPERRPAAQTLPDKRHPPKTPRASGHVLSGPTTLVSMQQQDDPAPATDESEQGQQRVMEPTRSASRGSMQRVVPQVPFQNSTHTHIHICTYICLCCRDSAIWRWPE